MTVLYGASDPASGFLRDHHAHRSFSAEYPVEQLNREVDRAYRLEPDALELLTSRCEVTTLARLLTADTGAIIHRVAGSAESGSIYHFMDAAKAHLAPKPAPRDADSQATPLIDPEMPVATDNLSSDLAALAKSARRDALLAELESGVRDSLPSRVPAIVSVRDVGLALSLSEDADRALQTGYLLELIPALAYWQAAESGAHPTSVEPQVEAAAEYCLAIASSTRPGAPIVPDEALPDWMATIDGAPPNRGSITDATANRKFVPPDPITGGSGVHRAIEGKRAYAELQLQLAAKVDTLRDEDGHLPGGIACYLSASVHPMAGSWLRVGGAPSKDPPPPAARDWIRTAGIRFERGLIEGSAERRTPDGELVIKTGDDWVQLEFGARPDEALRPGLYRGAEDMPFRKKEPGFHLGAPKFGFNQGRAEFVVLKQKQNDDGTVTAFTAMFRLSRYDVHGWVVYEQPPKMLHADEAAP